MTARTTSAMVYAPKRSRVASITRVDVHNTLKMFNPQKIIRKFAKNISSIFAQK